MNKKQIEILYKEHQVLPNIQAHMRAVAKYARILALKANKKGFKVRTNKITQAALLHDLFRLEKNHERVVANYLEKIGETALSKLVRFHGFFDIDNLKTLEEKLVFYADKRVCEDQIVTLKERFLEGQRRHPVPLQLRKKLKAAETAVYQLEKDLQKILGELPNHF